MKRLLLPLILLLSIPFNTSCISELTFEVAIHPAEGEQLHCQYSVPQKRATRGKDYIVNITSIDEGYELGESVDFFWIKIGRFDPIHPPPEGSREGGQWIYENNQLLIYGSVVTSKIDICITPYPKEQL